MSSVFFIVLQKPFSSGPKLHKNHWLRIGRHAFFGSIINLLWLFGLTLCGPMRTILLFEHSEIVVIAGASAIFSGVGGPSKLRGGVFFIIAVLGLLLFDHDDLRAKIADHPEGHHGSFITHGFYYLTSWIGLSDHMGGVMLLFLTLCMNAIYTNASKKLSVSIGGSKRLHALSTLVSFVLLLPWSLFIYFTSESTNSSIVSLFLPFLAVTIFIFVMDYYIEAVASNKLETTTTARYGSIAIFVMGLILSCFWKEEITTKIMVHSSFKEVIAEEHMLSGGVIFSLVLFIFATQILTSPNKLGRGSFIGYSSSGLPLYSITGDALQRTSQSIYIIARNGLRHILEDSDSRKIFYFLCINLSFTFVELLYGVWTNSLGLISDGFHMLFDCSALVMGLYAAVMSRWKATRIFSYGFDRVEVLSGYINALFLVVIAFFVFVEAVTRIFDPPEINTERLLTVSVAGLLVNFVGILAFHGHGHSHGGGGHGHSHGGGSSHGHSHGGHGHSHGGGGHSHSHGGGGGQHGHSHGGGHGHSHVHGSTNMKGVFLHVLADTLGSVGVIVSTIIIENFGWNVADPICSLFIAILIFLSVLPLLKDASMILLLRTPADSQKEIEETLQRMLSIEGVMGYRDQHFWQHSSDVMCGTLHLQILPGVNEQKILSQVTPMFKDIGINHLTIQILKEAYFEHMSGLGSHVDQSMEVTKNIQYLNFEETSHIIKAI